MIETYSYSQMMETEINTFSISDSLRKHRLNRQRVESFINIDNPQYFSKLLTPGYLMFIYDFDSLDSSTKDIFKCLVLNNIGEINIADLRFIRFCKLTADTFKKMNIKEKFLLLRSIAALTDAARYYLSRFYIQNNANLECFVYDWHKFGVSSLKDLESYFENCVFQSSNEIPGDNDLRLLIRNLSDQNYTHS